MVFWTNKTHQEVHPLMTQFAETAHPTCRTLLQQLIDMCRGPLETAARAAGADRYVKRYPSADFAMALVAHFLLNLNSLRELQIRLQTGRLKEGLALEGISVAHLPKLLHARPAQLWGPLVAKLISRLNRQQAPSALRVVDATFFRLGAKLFARRFRKDLTRNAGVKMTMMMDPETAIPLKWTTSVGNGHDGVHAERLLSSEDIGGLVFLIDRGYRKYRLYDNLIDRDADFVTLEAATIRYTVLQERLISGDSEVLSDQIVILGPKNAPHRMHNRVRRLVIETPKGEITFLTSLLEMPGEQVAQLYTRRWEIEVFFRWLKRQIGMIRPLGYSPLAAQHTIYAALVAYLIVLLAARVFTEYPDQKLSIAEALYHLRAALFQPANKALLNTFGFL